MEQGGIGELLEGSLRRRLTRGWWNGNRQEKRKLQEKRKKRNPKNTHSEGLADALQTSTSSLKSPKMWPQHWKVFIIERNVRDVLLLTSKSTMPKKKREKKTEKKPSKPFWAYF